MDLQTFLRMVGGRYVGNNRWQFENEALVERYIKAIRKEIGDPNKVTADGCVITVHGYIEKSEPDYFVQQVMNKAEVDGRWQLQWWNFVGQVFDAIAKHLGVKVEKPDEFSLLIGQISASRRTANVITINDTQYRPGQQGKLKEAMEKELVHLIINHD